MVYQKSLVIGMFVRPCNMHQRPCTQVDALNHPWCDECSPRHDLMNWGAVRGYPAICVRPYRIAADVTSWEFNVLCGDIEFVKRLLIGLHDHPEEALAEGLADPLMQQR